jgi:DNA-binding GntR family transcriptional regulator
MSGDRPLARRVLADQVKERLLEDILSGRLEPDSRIIETAVAKDLGISQAPVREALRGLEALGVVEITPFRGARVRRPSRQEIVEAYAVRSTLETLAARSAVPRLRDADVDELGGLLIAMRGAAARDDGAGVAEADARFHARIVELADNGTLSRLWSSLEPLSRTYLTLIGPDADLHWSAELHAPILDALRARDTERTVAALAEHFDDVRDTMARRWPEDAATAGSSPAAEVAPAATAHPIGA